MIFTVFNSFQDSFIHTSKKSTWIKNGNNGNFYVDSCSKNSQIRKKQGETPFLLQKLENFDVI